MPLHTVHVRVNDATTGKPTPCRIRFTDSAGTYYAPLGRLAEFPTGPGEDVGGNVLLGGTAYAYIDGSCEIRLSPGKLLVEISKGPEYTPVSREVTLGQGQISLRFAIERWADFRKEGWYSGDIDAAYLSPHAALLEGESEDVAVVNLLTSFDDEFSIDREAPFEVIRNILAFSGQRPALTHEGHMVVVNTTNWHDVLGSLLLLNCHRVVYPLKAGKPGDGWEEWTLEDWCDQCHRKGGLVVAAVLTEQLKKHPRAECLAEIVRGKIDVLDVSSTGLVPTDVYNAGCRIPVVAGSHKADNRTCLGQRRTYALLEPGQNLDYPAWIAAVRAGRTFATSGPLLSFAVNESPPGGAVHLGAGGARCTVRVRTWGREPLILRLLRNGEAIETIRAAEGSGLASLEIELPVERSCWLAATVSSGTDWACSSPVFVEQEGRPFQPDRAAAKTLLGRINEDEKRVKEDPRLSSERQKARLAQIFEDARRILAERVLSTES